MAAALWSTSLSLLESMMSTSPLEGFPFQVPVQSCVTNLVHPADLVCELLRRVSVAGSAFRVPVQELVDPSKVSCFGPGLGSGVRAQVPQTFTVDSSRAGVAPLEVQLFGPAGENPDGT